MPADTRAGRTWSESLAFSVSALRRRKGNCVAAATLPLQCTVIRHSETANFPPRNDLLEFEKCWRTSDERFEPIDTRCSSDCAWIPVSGYQWCSSWRAPAETGGPRPFSETRALSEFCDDHSRQSLPASSNAAHGYGIVSDTALHPQMHNYGPR
jgi:hypothetical protein